MTVRPRVKRSLRALSGRRVVIQGFSSRAPAFVAILGGEKPESAWLSPGELKKLVAAAKEILAVSGKEILR